jgi:hypothetical protein
MTYQTEKVRIGILIEINISVIGLMEIWPVKVFLFGLMEIDTRDSTEMTRSMEKAHTFMPMGIDTREGS